MNDFVTRPAVSEVTWTDDQQMFLWHLLKYVEQGDRSLAERVAALEAGRRMPGLFAKLSPEQQDAVRAGEMDLPQDSLPAWKLAKVGDTVEHKNRGPCKVVGLDEHPGADGRLMVIDPEDPEPWPAWNRLVLRILPPEPERPKDEEHFSAAVGLGEWPPYDGDDAPVDLKQDFETVMHDIVSRGDFFAKAIYAELHSMAEAERASGDAPSPASLDALKAEAAGDQSILWSAIAAWARKKTQHMASGVDVAVCSLLDRAHALGLSERVMPETADFFAGLDEDRFVLLHEIASDLHEVGSPRYEKLCELLNLIPAAPKPSPSRQPQTVTKAQIRAIRTGYNTKTSILRGADRSDPDELDSALASVMRAAISNLVIEGDTEAPKGE